MPSNSSPSAEHKAKHPPKRGTWENYKRCGRRLDQRTISEIFRLRLEGDTNKEIARKLKLHKLTVSKYVRGGTGQAPPVPIDAQVAEVQSAVRRVTGDFITQTFTKTLRNLDSMDDHFAKLVAAGKMPDQATPLHLKQLAEAKRLIVTLPQDLNRERRDLYDQLHGRREVEAEVTDVDELSDSGRMGLLESASDSDIAQESTE